MNNLNIFREEYIEPVTRAFTTDANSAMFNSSINSEPTNLTNISEGTNERNVSDRTVAVNTTMNASPGSNMIHTIRYNGYKGKRYSKSGGDITTKHIYDLNGNVVYLTQPVTAYRGVGWKERTETWAESDLRIPEGSTVEEALLYVAYNWDQTPGRYPFWNVTFNGNGIDYGNVSKGNGTPYTDMCNFSGYADYKYGLVVYNVSGKYNLSGTNTLLMREIGYNKNALYPSTLVVVYRNANETRKQIFINEECDELGLSESSYGTTPEETIAYTPFTGMYIDVSKIANATLYSFAGSAGTNEGDLLFNGHTVATRAWQGNGSTACSQVFDVKNYINETGNEAGIQCTVNGSMDTLQQILVLDYKEEAIPIPARSLIASSVAAFLFLVFILARRKKR
jgi:hypothetical protein